MAAAHKPNLCIIAGLNGVGKTTFARVFLPHYVDCLEFVNADLIADGLSPFASERAAIRAGGDEERTSPGPRSKMSCRGSFP